MYKIPAKTLFMGHSVVFMPECHSTNDEALKLYQKLNGTAEGTVVITQNQLAGRGQRGNRWLSAPGQNLTFSVILKPHFLSVSDQFLLNMAVSVALYDYLSAALPAAVKIKWPNDLLADEEKIAGILVENVLTGQQINCAVCGIGLNVNQLEWPLKATSMRHHLGKVLSLQEVFEQLMECLEPRYLMLRSSAEREPLREKYLEVLYRRGERHTYRSGPTEFRGTITGIDATGHLVVDTDQGIQAFDLKEISY